ncbi:MAG: putative glycolipid-binding domain-containing protein [Actinomycetota bacterium]
MTLEADGEGRWRVDCAPRPDLDECRDIDLESSACTNTIPIHSLGARCRRIRGRSRGLRGVARPDGGAARAAVPSRRGRPGAPPLRDVVRFVPVM